MLRRSFLQAAPLLGLLAACGKSAKIKLALDWKPEPEFGGFYAAPYTQHGLDVEILPGGAGTPTVQMVGAGSVDFGIVSGDEVVLARSHGNDVVALFAVFQNNPAGIMAHASRNLTNIGDVLKEGTLAIQSGLPFARLLARKYGFIRLVATSPLF
jgi:NitT/TauT family transport system substrate-binding protein